MLTLADIAKRFMIARFGPPCGKEEGEERDRWHERAGLVFDALDYYANREWEDDQC